VSEGTDLRIGETSEKAGNVIHQISVVHKAMLTLLDHVTYKVSKISPELLVVSVGHYQWVISRFLECNI